MSVITFLRLSKQAEAWWRASIWRSHRKVVIKQCSYHNNIIDIENRLPYSKVVYPAIIVLFSCLMEVNHIYIYMCHKTNHHWFRKRLAAKLAPRHYLNQCWNAGILLIRTLGINFGEIVSEIRILSFKRMHLEMSSTKMVTILSRPKCVEPNHNKGQQMREPLILGSGVNICTFFVRCLRPWDHYYVSQEIEIHYLSYCYRIKNWDNILQMF